MPTAALALAVGQASCLNGLLWMSSLLTPLRSPFLSCPDCRSSSLVCRHVPILNALFPCLCYDTSVLVRCWRGSFGAVQLLGLPPVMLACHSLGEFVLSVGCTLLKRWVLRTVLLYLPPQLYRDRHCAQCLLTWCFAVLPFNIS